MSKYQKLFLLVIALTIAAAITFVVRPIRPGLDIAGGLRVAFEINPKPGEWPKDTGERSRKMDTVKETMEQRVKGIGGVVEPIVRVQNPTSDKARLVVEIPGTHDREQVLARLRETALLEFFYMKDIQTAVNPLGTWKMEPVAGNEKEYTFTGPKGQALSTVEAAGNTPKQNRLNREKIITEVIGKNAKPILTGADILANAKSALRATTSEPIIEIQFNDKGSRIFSDFTGKHVGEILGIFYDRKLLTAPRINEKISQGQAEVSGFGSLDEATRVARFLNAGALPVDLKIMGEDTVEPSLGQATIAKVLVAGIAGLILVLMFMALYYKLPGLIADIALALYALFTIAAFKLLGATLSLAGMAALIISIGMAVDANILIFERLKEELKNGKTLRSAIDAGFNRAFSAIFDSNMCTAITCALLMWMGTATVQSFALTLLIGVALSMFTAITVTRTLLHLLVNWEWAQNPKLYGLTTGWLQKSGLNWDIVGKWKLYFSISAVLIIPGLIVLAMYGLKPGIEFTSGTTIQASLRSAATVPELLSVVDAVSPGSQVQLARGGKSAFITTKLLSEDRDYDNKVATLRQSIDRKFGLDAGGKRVFDSVSSVGPTISRELTTRAFWAIVIASVGIILYLTVRFAIGGLLTGLKYGTCAVLALAHDAAFIMGGFAIAGKLWGWETDSLFVTAVLTIIGFSVHDTIVVFDRIRENLRHRQRGEDFSTLANRSVLETLTRSINTSITVMLTLVALIVFGGPLLRQFYVTLLAGMAIGVYSTVFNATPMVILWDRIGGRGKSPARRVFEERPLVDTAPSNGGGATEAIDEITPEKSAPTARPARPKRKKKR